MIVNKEVQKHELGFYELVKKPTKEQLAAFYNDRYFDSKNFEVTYTDEEYLHKTLSFLEGIEVTGKSSGRFLDIGCGEGFSLDFYADKGWSVVGLDYSSDGVGRHFPGQLKNLRVGDIYEELDRIIENGETFDFIVCNNVLEHLLDPIGFTKKFRSILSPDGAVRIQVPNDYSCLQKMAIEKEMISNEFWVAPKEHMSYFTQESLSNLAAACGLNVLDTLGDFPIDFFLFNDNANYIKERSNGPLCHKARILIDNMVAAQGIEKLVAFRRGCGLAGLGRNAIIYAGLNND